MKETDNKTIKMWLWKDAPDEYKTNPDDADYVCFVPNELKNVYLPFLETGSWFGCCDIEEIKTNDGIAYIGYHA